MTAMLKPRSTRQGRGAALHRAAFHAARAGAMFLGGFALLNLVGGLARPTLDANIWWIDCSALPAWLAQPLLWAGAVLLVAFAVRPRLSGRRRAVSRWTVCILAALAAANAAHVCALWAAGAIRPAMPVPFSAIVSAVLALIFVEMGADAPTRRITLRGAIASLVVCGVLFALGQMYCFGKTTYDRKTDAVVVFGAGAYPDGRCSDALADRVRTACRLYRQGRAGTLIFSGGPGMGEVHETEAMRRLANRLGVPDDAILLDTGGVNTRATVTNTSEMIAAGRFRTVSAVSHFYHLPRVKMAYQRRGVEVYTVPARERTVLRAMPWYVAREVAAWWAYYFQLSVG